MGSPSITSRNTDTIPTAISFIVFASLVILTKAHQSISYPTPISFDLACRIGLGRNCPGPCPTRLLRKDQSPNKPLVTARRGGVLPVHILKNNHVGGFARWSLVRVSDMYSKTKHARAAFLFTCADVQVTKCTKQNQERDCKVDRLNEYYKYNLRIPRIYPDGYYVLGWLWYGGLVSTGTHGAFGEYWDCVYIEIKGGPIAEEHQPTFHAGATLTGKGGMCRSTTNRIGHCFREPCPFGNRPGTLMKPVEFEGDTPPRIMKKDFGYVQGKRYQMGHDGSHKHPETNDHHSNMQKADPQENVSEGALKLGSSQTATMNPKEWNVITGYTKNNMQSYGVEEVENFDANDSDVGKHVKKRDLPNMRDDRRNKKGMVAGLANKHADNGTNKVAKQRKLQKKLRKEKKLQNRKAKKARKAKARREKLERNRLRRKRIEMKRAQKRQRKKMQKQSRK